MKSYSDFLRSRLSLHFHRDKFPDVFLYASPRGGSTWITELVRSQPGFRMVSEPLNLRKPLAVDYLGSSSFANLYGDEGWKRIQPYYRDLLANRISAYRPWPGRKFYRPLTWRTVIKENQGAGDQLARIESEFGCRIVHVLRHPIAVALSREVFPLLVDFHRCPLREHFQSEELSLADKMIKQGNHLEKGVVAWCLHHRPALDAQRSSWFVCTYEAMVMHPDPIVNALTTHIKASRPDKMRATLTRPSNVARKSDAETQFLLHDDGEREKLVTKWMSKVSEDGRKRAADILNTFSIRLYKADEPKPKRTDHILTDCGPI